MERLLIINPGSTSTKVAVFDGEGELFRENIAHALDELKAYSWVMDQLGLRVQCVRDALKRNGVEERSLSCVMARGGMLPPCEAGAYGIDSDMLAYMFAQRVETHISNVGCAIADAIAQPLGIPAYIYDPVVVDELTPIARITGLPELPKESRGHALNAREMARRCASAVLNKPMEECTLIVQHLGGGSSTWLFQGGRAVDMYSDDDAGFAPERCGRLQAMPLVRLCYSGKYAYKEMADLVRGASGLRAHLGTSDAREVERMVDSGDAHAALVYGALAYGSAKAIGDLATAVCGKVDRIVLTGGLVHSKRLSGAIRERVEWIAPVEVMAGEHEMEALAAAGLRLLRGTETPRTFVWKR